MKFSFVPFALYFILTFRVTSSRRENLRTDDVVLSTPEECARQCQEDEKPRTCYYHWTVEHFSTLGSACDLCRSNGTTRLRDDCQCLTSDGFESSSLLTANRMFPGPAIVVCLHDFVVVDVANHAPGTEITIHWHGLYQKSYQHYDGVPYVTQCPIHEGTTFRYQWRAENPGTHFWHSHSGLQKSDGLDGPLIVRQPKVNEPSKHLWDQDELENVIIINDFLHDGADNHFPGTVRDNVGQLPDNFVINGLGQWTDPQSGHTTETPLAHFIVKSGKRYRFRLINSCSLTCAVQMTIEGHNITVIATDGMPIKPVNVTSITSASAERYDFVLNADKKIARYWMQFRGLGGCGSKKLQQLAILAYETAPSATKSPRPSYDVGIDPGIILNPLNIRCNDPSNSDKYVCLTKVESISHVPQEIMRQEPDLRLYLPFNFYFFSLEKAFEPGKYQRFLATPRPVTGLVGNISNVLPQSPFLSQRKSIPEEQICSSDKSPRCENAKPCECSHVQKVPLDSVVEIILIDEVQIPGMAHPFHLHGHVFYIIGEGQSWEHNVSSINVEKTKELDRNGFLTRNLRKPLAKDTYSVPNNGYSIIRFHAVNPGYWFFHCHFAFHMEVGMSLTFQVGEDSDMPPVPKGFPTCANFIPPIHLQ